MLWALARAWTVTTAVVAAVSVALVTTWLAAALVAVALVSGSMAWSGLSLLVSPEEAADALGVGRSTVYDLMRLRVVPSVRIGRARRIPAQALREYVERLAEVGEGV